MVPNADVALRITVPSMKPGGTFTTDELGFAPKQRTFNRTRSADPLSNLAANYFPLVSVASSSSVISELALTPLGPLTATLPRISDLRRA